TAAGPSRPDKDRGRPTKISIASSGAASEARASRSPLPPRTTVSGVARTPPEAPRAPPIPAGTRTTRRPPPRPPPPLTPGEHATPLPGVPDAFLQCATNTLKRGICCGRSRTGRAPALRDVGLAATAAAERPGRPAHQRARGEPEPAPGLVDRDDHHRPVRRGA